MYVECALLSVLDCLQSAGNPMLYLVQCPGSAYMNILNDGAIDELRGVCERKVKIELPDNLSVNWNPQVLLLSFEILF